MEVRIINIQKLINNKVSLKRDFIFKMVLANNKEILIDLLNAVTEYNIKDIKILSKDFTLDKYKENGKFGILDIMSELEDGTQIDIEMQMTDEYNTIERFLFYLSGMYYKSLKSGEDYSKTKKSVVIGFLNYELFKDDYNYISQSDYYIYKKDENNVIHKVSTLNDKLKMYIIELPKFKKMKYCLEKKIDQWITAINCDNFEEVEEVMCKNIKIKSALNEIEKLSTDDDVLEIISRDEDDRKKANDFKNKYINIGIERGIEQGIEQINNFKITIIKNLLNENKTVQEISEIIGISVQEVEEILENNNM